MFHFNDEKTKFVVKKKEKKKQTFLQRPVKIFFNIKHLKI